ncbi:MAG: hypothetical protein ACTH6N_05875 [Brachybacterium tyrofermentans]|uniref:hypothetical protein n=1 Tax=Brachybacterium tyrofermentans TaxID=47848 RepID=UPI00186796FE|nr:hypothetical protein [Brachybacterium tyrofermentans]
MTSIDRRHRGRAIRRNRKRRPGTHLAFVTIEADLSGFVRAINRAAKAFGRAYQHPRQVIHNGRKP